MNTGPDQSEVRLSIAATKYVRHATRPQNNWTFANASFSLVKEMLFYTLENKVLNTTVFFKFKFIKINPSRAS